MGRFNFKGREALEVSAALIEPIGNIVTDSEIVALIKARQFHRVAKPMIAKYCDDVIEILAVLNGKPADEFEKEINLLTLPITLFNVITDPDLQKLFTSLAQSADEIASGSAMESTEETETT